MSGFTILGSNKLGFNLAPIDITSSPEEEIVSPKKQKREAIEENDELANIKKEISDKISNPDASSINYIKAIMASKPISTHKRQFDINSIIPQKFTSRVFIDPNNNDIIKLYNYNNCDYCNNILINEIAAQIYAKLLECELIEIPSINDYGKFPNENIDEDFNYDTFFYIVMENISGYKQLGSLEKLNLNDDLCSHVETKVNEATKCLANHHFFHNDLHKENVFIDTENMKVGLIDFGKAKVGKDKVNEMYKPKRYVCNKKEYTIGIGSSGGKTRRRRNRKTRKNKKQKNARSKKSKRSFYTDEDLKS